MTKKTMPRVMKAGAKVAKEVSFVVSPIARKAALFARKPNPRIRSDFAFSICMILKMGPNARNKPRGEATSA